jgi:hypothetical protein
LRTAGVDGVYASIKTFHRTVQDIKSRNANTNSEELRRNVDEAVREVRTQRPQEK